MSIAEEELLPKLRQENEQIKTEIKTLMQQVKVKQKQVVMNNKVILAITKPMYRKGKMGRPAGKMAKN